MVQSQGPTLNNCKVIHPWSLTGSSALPRKETRTRLQKSCFRGELVIVQGVNTWLEGLAGYTESMFPRHPGTINTFWRVNGVFDLCMLWWFCCHTEPQLRKTWMTGITTGWVQLWGGVTFLEVKGRHQPLSWNWNCMKPPKPGPQTTLFSTTKHAKMRGSHNRFPTWDVLNSKCLVDAPVGEIEGFSNPNSNLWNDGFFHKVGSLKVEISSKYFGWFSWIFFSKLRKIGQNVDPRHDVWNMGRLLVNNYF